MSITPFNNLTETEYQADKYKYVYKAIKMKNLFKCYWWSLKGPVVFRYWAAVYLAALSDFLGRSTAWMLGRTPPWAMVTPASSLFSSSSFLMASWR